MVSACCVSNKRVCFPLEMANKSSVVHLAPFVALLGSFSPRLFSTSFLVLSYRHFFRLGLKIALKLWLFALCVVKAALPTYCQFSGQRAT